MRPSSLSSSSSSSLSSLLSYTSYDVSEIYVIPQLAGDIKTHVYLYIIIHNLVSTQWEKSQISVGVNFNCNKL